MDRTLQLLFNAAFYCENHLDFPIFDFLYRWLVHQIEQAAEQAHTLWLEDMAKVNLTQSSRTHRQVGTHCLPRSDIARIPHIGTARWIGQVCVCAC